jgi:hypothetical protein
MFLRACINTYKQICSTNSQYLTNMKIVIINKWRYVSIGLCLYTFVDITVL